MSPEAARSLLPTSPSAGGAGQAFHSTDLDETRRQIGRLLKPHSLCIEGRQTTLNATLREWRFGPLSLVHLEHGADVLIDPDTLLDFFALQIPTRGCTQYSIDGQVFDIAPGRACLISPTQRVWMRFAADCAHVILRVDRSFLQQLLMDELGEPIPNPLVFQPALDLRAAGAAGVVGLLDYLQQRGASCDPAYARSEVQADFARLMVRTMLHALNNNYSQRLAGEDSPRALPRYVKKAESFIADNITTRLTPERIAAAACISVRALHRAFREHRQTSMMEYVKLCKLQAVHGLLQHPGFEESVSHVAYRFGFDHLGHFSSSYHKLFGELPHETLKSRTGR